MRRIGIRRDAGRILLGQVATRRKHPRRHEIEPGTRDQPGNDATGAGLADRVRGDEHIGKFFGHR